MADIDYFREAEILSHYLIHQSPSKKEKLLYADAMQKLNIHLSLEEEKKWNFLMKNNWALPFADAALAVKNPSSTIRRKIFLMLAILEASPKHCEYFLPKKYSSLYLVTFFFVSIRAIARRIFGSLLLKFI
ncbi:MAG: hypothetical protein HY063_11900 [Bacteroidetes bacterium]|nr:hypothetical protein [Bacteroidota bacterium]